MVKVNGLVLMGVKEGILKRRAYRSLAPVRISHEIIEGLKNNYRGGSREE